ncbi:MAG TPA: imidazolonepropionase [Candidatus Limnocylindrales bacterium]|nr:imidazolonepropionase [Candidatus Limnocylindrales bacterium]
MLANIGQLLTLRGDSAPRRGSALDDIGLLKDAALLCGGGKIIALGSQREMLRSTWLKDNRKKVHEVDCQGKVVVPGLIDCHTHPVFSQPRLIDFEKRIAGAGYEQIAQAGGGIRSSVAGVREASRNELAEKVSAALRAMLRHGTSVVEAKSGYGLSVEAEIKSLEAIREAAKFWPGTVKPTLLAAHVVPQEYAGRQGEYVRLVCEEIIPLVARRKLAEYVDVFCERGAFTLQQSAQIMAAARRHGLDTRAHVCQFTPSQLSGLLEHNPASLDHMDCIAEPDFKVLAGSATVAVLLPGANYFLGHKEFPNARRLIEEGVAMALATDYNPGTSPTVSMPFVISLACTHMKMTPAEAIAASTMNAACALRLQSRKGSIEPGKDADLAVFDVPDYREIAYWFAWNRCAEMVVGGELQDFAAN